MSGKSHVTNALGSVHEASVSLPNISRSRGFVRSSSEPATTNGVSSTITVGVSRTDQLDEAVSVQYRISEINY